MLAQKIALENKERAVLALANRGNRYEMLADLDDGRQPSLREERM